MGWMFEFSGLMFVIVEGWYCGLFYDLVGDFINMGIVVVEMMKSVCKNVGMDG